MRMEWILHLTTFLRRAEDFFILQLFHQAEATEFLKVVRWVFLNFHLTTFLCQAERIVKLFSIVLAFTRKKL